eukprot:6361952-Ditylum_brightwellii.AAC.1
MTGGLIIAWCDKIGNELACWDGSQVCSHSAISNKPYIKNGWGGRVASSSKNLPLLVNSSSKTDDKKL